MFSKQSQFLRALLIVFLVLILQVPTAMLNGVANERQGLRAEAVSEITTKWGTSQEIVGPRLYVPYVKRVTKGEGDKQKTETESKFAVFLPEQLDITGALKTEIRKRSIFEVPVYTSDLTLQGSFERPNPAQWGAEKESDIRWDQAELVIEVSDAHALNVKEAAVWAGKPLQFEAGKGKYASQNVDSNQYNAEGVPISSAGIVSKLSGKMVGDRFDFTIPLRLQGSERLTFAPLGKETNVQVSANWGDPSFQGKWLPADSKIEKNRFEANWTVQAIGRNYGQSWSGDSPVADATIRESLFGVDLISPVDNYRMSQRSLKYNFLFLLLTFVTFWLFEITSNLRVHPLQYLLVGAAMTMFYLLQLALSEHLGFDHAYLLSSAAVVLMIATYSVAVLRAKGRGLIIGLMEAALYGYLYFVLASQSYSLLIGSFGLFGFLAVAMYFTRSMDWLEPAEPKAPNPPKLGLTENLPNPRPPAEPGA
jgi:inner membrane protein